MQQAMAAYAGQPTYFAYAPAAVAAAGATATSPQQAAVGAASAAAAQPVYGHVQPNYLVQTPGQQAAVVAAAAAQQAAQQQQLYAQLGINLNMLQAQPFQHPGAAGPAALQLDAFGRPVAAGAVPPNPANPTRIVNLGRHHPYQRN